MDVPCSVVGDADRESLGCILHMAAWVTFPATLPLPAFVCFFHDSRSDDHGGVSNQF